LAARLIANFHRREITREEKEGWINGLARIYQLQGLKVSGTRIGSAGDTPNEIKQKLIEVTGLADHTVLEYLSKDFKQDQIDGSVSTTPISEKVGAQNYAPDPFEEWFTEHVTMGDVSDVLEKELLRLETDFLAKLSPILSMFTSAT